MAEIRYQFTAAGWDGVERTFEKAEDAAISYQRTVQRAARETTSTTRKAATESAGIGRAHANRTVTLARQIERDQMQATERDKARLRGRLTAEIRAGEASGKAQARTAEQGRRIRERHFAMEKKLHDRRVALAKQAAEREGKVRGKADADLLARRRKSSMFSGISGYDVANSVIGGAAKGAIGLAAAGASVFAGVTGAAAKDAMRLQETANRLSINSRSSGKGFVDATTLRKEFEATAIATPGVGSQDIAEAVQAFVTKTGRLDVARKMSGTFATVASATGSDVQAISRAASDLFQKFDITSIEQMQEALAALTFQGKEGAFELEAAADKFAKMGAAAAAFGFDKGVKGVRALGGLSQIAMASTGDKDVAATAVEAMLRQFVTESGTIKRKTGVNVFADKTKTKTRDIIHLLAETIAGSGGDLTVLQDIFKDEGGKAIKPLIDTFNRAQNELGPKATKEQRAAAGKKAVEAQLNTAINAPGTFADVQKDAAQAQTTASAKMDAAWEKLQAAVGEKLVPILTELATAAADSKPLMDAFTVALGAMVDFLYATGVITRKGKTTGEIEEEAKKEKADAIAKQQQIVDEAQARKKRSYTDKELQEIAKLPIDQQRAAMGLLTAAEQSDYNTAGAKATLADQKIFDARLLDTKTKLAETPQGFAESYAALGNPTDDAEFAKTVAAGMFKNNNFTPPIFYDNETEAQRTLRRGVATKQGGEAEAVGGKVDTAGFDAAIQRMIAAFNAAAGNIAGVTGNKTASVVPG
jgi:hypothetical protein